MSSSTGKMRLDAKHVERNGIVESIIVGRCENPNVNTLYEIDLYELDGNNKVINGNLDIWNPSIDKVPKGLIIEGNLYIEYCNGLYLSDDLYVKGWIVCNDLI